MVEWLKRRAESLLDSLIFAVIVAGCVALWTAIKALPLWKIAAFCVITFLVVLVVIRIISTFVVSHKKLQRIPEILNRRHQRLSALVEKQVGENPINPELVGADYIELLGRNDLIPEFKQLDGVTDNKVAYNILVGIIEKIKSRNIEDFMSFMVNIGYLMDAKKIGLKKISSNDNEYINLTKQLERLRPKVPKELDEVINNHVQSSFGMNSLFLLLGSIPREDSLMKILPPEFRAAFEGFKTEMDVYMNGLLAEVTSVIQELMRKNKGMQK